MEVTILRVKEKCGHFNSFSSKYRHKLFIMLTNINTIPLNFNYGGAEISIWIQKRMSATWLWLTVGFIITPKVQVLVSSWHGNVVKNQSPVVESGKEIKCGTSGNWGPHQVFFLWAPLVIYIFPFRHVHTDTYIYLPATQSVVGWPGISWGINIYQ